MFGLAFGGHCDMWVVYSVQQHSNFVVVSCYGLHNYNRSSVRLSFKEGVCSENINPFFAVLLK